MRKTVDEWLDARRLEMLVTWDELATLADISAVTLRRIRKEQPVRPLQATKLENAVSWEHGSLKHIRQGKPPTMRRPEGPEADHVPILEQPSPELRSDDERRFWEGMGDMNYDGKISLLQLYRHRRSWGEESTGTDT